LEAVAAQIAASGHVRSEKRSHCIAVAVAIVAVPHRIEPDLETTRARGRNPERLEERGREVDHLGVEPRVEATQELDVELRELPLAPLLRPLVAEHRT